MYSIMMKRIMIFGFLLGTFALGIASCTKEMKDLDGQ